MSPGAILFDALGTLLELRPPAPRLRGELARRYQVTVTDAEAARAIAAEIAFYRRHLEEGREAASLADLRERCAEALREALPERIKPHLPPAAELVDALLASLEFRAYPDAAPALASYRDRGCRLVVVSNWDVSLHSVLADVGLRQLLDAVLTAADAGARKPAPEIFAQALQLACVTAAEALHVGDSLDEDVGGARAAGVEPILLARDGAPRAAGVRTISSLAEPLF